MITADDIPAFAGQDDLPPNYYEALRHAVLQERVRRDAKRIVDDADRPPIQFPTIETLQERLARPVEPIVWRIEQWQPHGSNLLLSAPFKGGKTQLRNNYIRSNVDGDPFLGEYQVRPTSGTVAVIDIEMGHTQGETWLREQSIRATDRVLPVWLRGRAPAFDIRDDRIRARWASIFADRGVDTLILDCLRPLCDALGLDENHDGGLILAAFDALKVDAKIPNGLVIHHMGHMGERARGDSRFRDWPDVEIRLVRQDEDPRSPRFITAYGRDVDVPEAQLHFDPATRRLTVLGGSRHDQKLGAVLDAIREALDGSTSPMSGRALKRALADTDHGKDTIDAALRFGVRTDALLAVSGPHNSRLYSSVRVSGPSIKGRTPDTTVPGHWPDTAGHPDTGEQQGKPDFHFDGDAFGRTRPS